MIAYISKKSSFLRFLASFLSAAGIAALLCFLFYGPRLGLHYDFLLKLRPAPPISQEILIIDSAGDILEPGLLSSVLYTTTELGAGTLLIQVPILGLSIGGSAGEEEILYRFDEEFSILSSNIRNLFDGIRTGSVAPRDSERYVRELMELSERGKERLVSALVHRDMEGIIDMENAAALFGQARRPGDLLVQLIRTGEGGRPGVLAASDEYSRARPDRDGVLRRIAPVLTAPNLSGEAGSIYLEHIAYAALKSRQEISIVPRDKNGAILFELPGEGRDFRRISILDFLIYDEADRFLRQLLLEGEALGLYRNIYGENRPDILYDYALFIREEPASSFEGGNEEKRLLWLQARNRFFEVLEDFLYDPVDMDLVMALRARYEDFLELRNNLASAVSHSFCILGNTRDVEASALLANSIITGRAIEPGRIEYLFFAALLTAFLSCFFIKSRGLMPTLIIGVSLILLLTAGFCLSFIFSGLWLDPLVPFAAGATGVLVSFAWALLARARYNSHFRMAFGPYISKTHLKNLIRAGKPLPSQTITAKAIVIAIKKSQMPASQNTTDPTKSLLVFQQRASDIFKKAGGTIVGIEGELVIACFGSPLESMMANTDWASLALKAANLVSEITLHPECASWNFGLDVGNCVFTWTALSGYFATSVVVQKAKLLSRLTDRYKVRIIVSTAMDYILPPELTVKKLSVLKSKDGLREEPFYHMEAID